MRTLFDETRIKGMTLNNRLVRSATWEGMATEDGRLTPRLFKLYEELAKGGTGLIVTGYAYVMQDEQPNPAMMGIYDDRFIEDYRPLTEMVHSHGSSIVLQVAYGGTQTWFRPEGRVIWGASAVPEFGTGVVAKEMTLEEIGTLVRAFGDAAARSQKAGFDGVQLHCAHGYFLSQFLSPFHNRRTDAYGGSIENRARLLIEVYEEARRRVGADYPILIKINSSDFIDGGSTFEECRYVCRELAARGLDGIEISGGIISAGRERNFMRTNIDSPEKEAYFAEYATRIAEENDIPVILVGGLRSPEVMESLLEKTKISYFSLSRPLLTEPDLVRRWQAGDRKAAKCVSCNKCRGPEGVVCILRREAA